MGPSARKATAPAAALPRPAIVDLVVFYALVALFCLRPLIPETFVQDEPSFLTVAVGQSGPTPATTLWLDALVLLCAVIGLVRARRRAAIGRLYLAGVALLAAALVVSVSAAADTRSAVNAGFSLLIPVLGGGALVSVLRTRWMARLLLAAALASGGTNALKCITQQADEFRETRKYWENEIKPALEARGQDLSDPLVVNYERRLASAESFGYLAGHPNITGATLMMCLLTAAGALAGRVAESRRMHTGTDEVGPIAAVAILACVAAALAVGLWFTHSEGALVGAVVGGVCLACAFIARRGIARRPGRTLALLALLYAVGISAGAAYGMLKGTLPHPSLAFRWFYWSTAAEVYTDAPWTGIGRENFGDAYMQYKPAVSTEEVRDPHNLWLTMLVEMGPLGLIAAVVLCWAGLGSLFARLEDARQPSLPAPQDWRWAIRWAPLVVGFPLLHLLFSTDATRLLWRILNRGTLAGLPSAGGGAPSVSMFLIWLAMVAIVWSVLLIFSYWALDSEPAAERGTSWAVAGCAAALIGALVHGLITFALTTPAGLATFIALSAAAVGLGRAGADAPPTSPAPGGNRAGGAGYALWFAAAAVFATYLVVCVVPVTRAELDLHTMRAALARARTPADAKAALHWGRRAISADPAGGYAAKTTARAAFELAKALPERENRVAALNEATQLAELALRRNPRDGSVSSLLASIYESLEEEYLYAARTDEAIAALEQAVRFRQRAVELYPTNPRIRLSAGAAWLRLWKETERAADGRLAARQFAAALEIDATRPPGEVVRLRPLELQIIAGGLRELAGAGIEARGAGAATQPPSGAAP